MKIFQEPSLEVKSKITACLFARGKDDVSADAFAKYFEYYEEELRLLRVGANPNIWQAGHLAVDQHEDVVEVVKLLRRLKDRTRKDVEDEVAKCFKNADPDCISRSIDLAIRLWLMINVRESQFRSLRPLCTCVDWQKEKTLEDLMRDLFPSSRWKVSARDSRVDVHFTAVMMVEVCGLKIHWTSSLQDHLLLDRRKRILSVFGFKDLLDCKDPE
jgi:hypothetical protein